MDNKMKERSESEDSQDNYQPTDKKKARYREQYEQEQQQIHSRMNRQQNGDFIYQLKNRYDREMEQSQYTNAQRTKDKIYYVSEKVKKRKIRATSVGHSREKTFLKDAHKDQMKSFNLTWIQIFQAQRADQQRKFRKLQMLKQRDTQMYKCEVLRRCQSAKPTKKIAELHSVEKTQKLLRKRGKTQQLKKIRQQKVKLRKQCENEHKRMIDRIVFQQQKKFEQKQTKRYHSFMHRIQQTRQDNERKYRREQRRLKQKYKNILRNLEHEQKLQLSYLKNMVF